MKTPVTQEEKDYRESLTNQISAISNMQSLFADIEDKGRKLEILKILVSGLNYGDDLLTVIDQEISAAEEAAKAEAEAANAENSEEDSTPDSTPKETDLDFDLGEAGIAQEAFKATESTQPLVEDIDLVLDEEALPTPEELDKEKDFTKNE
jgi:hypothetical protein